jgi:pyridoxine 4-dehydrogenase
VDSLCSLQVVLNWNLRRGFLVLVGARTPQQVEENLGALGWELAPGEQETIDTAARKVRKQMVQNSFQGE